MLAMIFSQTLCAKSKTILSIDAQVFINCSWPLLLELQPSLLHGKRYFLLDQKTFQQTVSSTYLHENA